MNEPASHTVLADRWKLVAPIARTGTEVSYLAEDTLTGSKALVRVFHTDGDALLQRIANHRAAAVSLHPPVVLRVLAAGQAGSAGKAAAFVATAFVEAETLRERLRRRVSPMSPREALPIARRILEALRVLHDAEVVHADLCPASCVILAQHDPSARETPVRFYDLGYSRAPAQTYAPTGRADNGYMAPEIRDGAPASASADVYSMGVMLFEMLTGLTPRTPDQSAGPTLASLIDERDLADVHRRATALNPKERYQDAAAMLSALNALRPLRRARLPSHSPFSSRTVNDSVELELPRPGEVTGSNSGLSVVFDEALVTSLQQDAQTPVAVDPVRFDQPTTARNPHDARQTQPVAPVADAPPAHRLPGAPPVEPPDDKRSTSASIDGMVLPALPKTPPASNG